MHLYCVHVCSCSCVCTCVHARVSISVHLLSSHPTLSLSVRVFPVSVCVLHAFFRPQVLDSNCLLPHTASQPGITYKGRGLGHPPYYICVQLKVLKPLQQFSMATRRLPARNPSCRISAVDVGVPYVSNNQHRANWNTVIIHTEAKGLKSSNQQVAWLEPQSWGFFKACPVGLTDSYLYVYIHWSQRVK